ncbi:MAG: hypothetical protein AAF750_04460 [Planctomycetota bacterium]
MGETSASKADVTGVLPRDWRDDSAWADVAVDYSTIRSGAFEGEQALRVEVTRVSSGQVQLALRNVPMLEDRAIELSFAARSPTGTPIRLRLQQKAPPYRMRWEAVVPVAAEWGRVSRVLPPTVNDNGTQFLIVIEQRGVVDLDAFALRYIDPPEDGRASALTQNLLPVSSFPDGLPAPWLLRDRLVAETNTTETGPTGASALRLISPPRYNAAAFTASILLGFYGTAGVDHTLSLYAKAETPGANMALRMGPPSKPIFKEPFGSYQPVGSEWARYEHTVTLPANEDGYYILQIAITHDTALLIDGLQLEAATRATPPTLTGPAELTLQPAQTKGVFTDDEPLVLRASTLGTIPDGAVLRASIEQIGGRSADLDPIAVPVAGFDRFEVPIGGRIAQRFGSFRVEAWIESADGSPLTRKAEALMMRVRTPRFANERRPESPFGIHWRTGHLSEDEARTAKKLGFNWLRLFSTVAWHSVEVEPGRFDFSRADRDIELLEANHLMGLGIVGTGAPKWYADNPHDYRGWACFAPTDLEPWRRYSEALVQRYRGRMDHFEAWNEPYYPHFFTKTVTPDGVRQIASAERYVEVHRVFKEALDTHNPDAVLAWNTSATAAPQRTLDTIAAGVLDYTDAVSIHEYNGSSAIEDVLIGHAESVREKMGPQADRLPLWNTEGGHGMSQLFNVYRHVPPTLSEDHAVFWANWLCRYYLGSLESGVDKFFLYLIAPNPWWKAGYSVSNVDGRLGPNMAALSNLFWQVDGTRFVERVPRSDGLIALVFASDERRVLVLHRPSGAPDFVDLPKDAERFDLWGNPMSPRRPVGLNLSYVQTSATPAELVRKLAQP